MKDLNTIYTCGAAGMVGEDWLCTLDNWNRGFNPVGINVFSDAKDIIQKLDFSGVGVPKGNIVLISRSEFDPVKTTYKQISEETSALGFSSHKTSPEVALLLSLEMQSLGIENMKFRRIIMMHEPVLDSEGQKIHLGMKKQAKQLNLKAYIDQKQYVLTSETAFAFFQPAG
ncbi:MAG: hypothetical protein WC087_03440 [Candidatus Paceibacterota bacterium]